jgi:hypothetical protein
VKLSPDPRLDIIALTTGGRSHERPEEGLRIGFERCRRVLAELAGGRTALASYAPTNPVYQHTARAGCLAENFAFNNVVGHDV